MDRAVEVTHTADGITLLFDTFSGESKNLLESFKNAGAAFHAAVIEDDGFLPDDVMSVYGFFLGDYRKADSLPGKPLYFNQIQIPDYWRIEGDNSSAKVMDRTRERARIFFTEPTHRRQVKIVDWLDDAGQVRLSEHYNRYGAIFCHTVFNKKGQKALRKFFDVTGREMIVENFVTGDILVRWQDKDWIFRSKTTRCHIRFLHHRRLRQTAFATHSSGTSRWVMRYQAICRLYCMIRERGQSAYLCRAGSPTTGL